MPRTKISKVARALNIGLQTAVDFLDKKGISVDTNPNTKIDFNCRCFYYFKYALGAAEIAHQLKALGSFSFILHA